MINDELDIKALKEIYYIHSLEDQMVKDFDFSEWLQIQVDEGMILKIAGKYYSSNPGPQYDETNNIEKFRGCC